MHTHMRDRLGKETGTEIIGPKSHEISVDGEKAINKVQPFKTQALKNLVSHNNLMKAVSEKSVGICSKWRKTSMHF